MITYPSVPVVSGVSAANYARVVLTGRLDPYATGYASLRWNVGAGSGCHFRSVVSSRSGTDVVVDMLEPPAPNAQNRVFNTTGVAYTPSVFVPGEGLVHARSIIWARHNGVNADFAAYRTTDTGGEDWPADEWSPLYRSGMAEWAYARTNYIGTFDFDIDFALEGNLDNYVRCPIRFRIQA